MALVGTALLLLATLTTLGSAVNNLCPSNIPKNEFLIQHGGFCYEFVVNRPADWYHARDDCKNKGGYLIDIHSYAEQGYIANHVQIVNPNDKGLWIGLTDENHEKDWTWVSGVKLGFTNWASGQPGVIGNLENCALMEFSNTGAWHDYPCHGIFSTERHGWICKYDILT